MNRLFSHRIFAVKKTLTDFSNSGQLGAVTKHSVRWVRHRPRVPPSDEPNTSLDRDIFDEPFGDEAAAGGTDNRDDGRLHRESRAVKALQKYREKYLLNLNFDHIPIEDQVVLMFPGQGAQFVGMGGKVIDHPSSAELFDRAGQLLGYDLLEVCRRGPKTKLDQTRYCQLATFVASMAALEKLKTVEVPDLMDRVTDAVGFSIGEYCAHVVGGVLTFEDALRVINIRAEAMHECSQLTPSGMITVRVSAASRLDDAMFNARELARENGERAVCDVANFLYCGVKVVGGTQTCLNYLEENATRFQFQVVKRLAVSGAFHTTLMADAERRVADALAAVEVRPPRVNVYSNYTGKVLPRRVPEIQKCIIRQISSPVKWEQIQQLLFRKHQDYKFPSYYEVGPGRQLGVMLCQISKKAYENYYHYSC